MQGCGFQLDLSQHFPGTSYQNVEWVAAGGGRLHPPPPAQDGCVCSLTHALEGNQELAEALDSVSPMALPTP